ncbi:hypothetical protein [Fusobacterium ulcerans]|uniref:Uncharacterized protein n=2 Tax=Fusobacterium ulcerans TaxID=861 RepID=H1PST2_9FUSO|nr:hypothetical protein [Fusobacterium ulcerans]EHO81811.1 hypothetical protein HMPREF0402_01475 [Fusobacterium ulcerans 12-1B]MCB8564190.1 hypothetical protein [Fusobacterium ulcerans]MCB8648519.1 hypothetical protein [Fusobacterium ulcerans]RGY67054.1 hypothetical protein DXA30_00360 [Fusobacterium ulcerans]
MKQYSCFVMDDGYSSININNYIKKAGLQVEKNNKNEYKILNEDLLFTVINPQLIPEHEVADKIFLMYDEELCNIKYTVTYDHSSDKTTLEFSL